MTYGGAYSYTVRRCSSAEAPPAVRAGYPSHSGHTDHKSLSRISQGHAQPRQAVPLCVALIPNLFPIQNLPLRPLLFCQRHSLSRPPLRLSSSVSVFLGGFAPSQDRHEDGLVCYPLPSPHFVRPVAASYLIRIRTCRHCTSLIATNVSSHTLANVCACCSVFSIQTRSATISTKLVISSHPCN